MAMASEEHTKPTLVTERTPVGPVASGSSVSIGGMAFQDSVMIIGIAWVLLALLVFSLRRHNI